MMAEPRDWLRWQSQGVLILVALSALVADVRGVLGNGWNVTVWAVVVSMIFGAVVWKLKAATSAGALLGAAITMALMYAIALPYHPLHTGLSPLLALFLLTYAATKVGRRRKEQLGVAESKRGRAASQIAANLGAAALLIATPFGAGLALAALAEAAADTTASELGQVLGGTPRMLTTFRRVPAGTDGAVTFAGTLAGALAALLIALVGAWALRDMRLAFVAFCGGVFGLFFDSLLGATVEDTNIRSGWLNNDAVNFLSTLAAAGFAALL